MSALAFVAVYLVQHPFRKPERWQLCLAGVFVKSVLATALAFFLVAVDSSFAWNYGYPLCALYVVLVADAAADIVVLIALRTHRKITRRFRLILSGLLTAALLAYGTINMQVVSPKEHIYTSPKLQQEHRFVFLSDLHYGSAQSAATVEKALSEIAAAEPDFILLGGDITDEMTSAEEMHHLYATFKAMNIPTYFIFGNHDRQDNAHLLGGALYSPEELEETLDESGIHILKDEWTQVASDLVVLGREDPSAGTARIPVTDLVPRPEDAFVICVDHTPYQEKDITDTRADLQLSGHTHAGQLFPLSLVYRLGVNNIYGDYHIGETDLYVSSGIAGWSFPFRTAAHCNYEIVSLVPAQ